jgi:hypothetical protein
VKDTEGKKKRRTWLVELLDESGAVIKDELVRASSWGAARWVVAMGGGGRWPDEHSSRIPCTEVTRGR